MSKDAAAQAPEAPEANEQDQADEEEASPARVTVSLLAGESIPVDFEPDLTVADYLNRAGVAVGPGQVVTLNGEQAGEDTPVESNSVIVVVGKVANG